MEHYDQKVIGDCRKLINEYKSGKWGYSTPGKVSDLFELISDNSLFIHVLEPSFGSMSCSNCGHRDNICTMECGTRYLYKWNQTTLYFNNPEEYTRKLALVKMNSPETMKLDTSKTPSHGNSSFEVVCGGEAIKKCLPNYGTRGTMLEKSIFDKNPDGIVFKKYTDALLYLCMEFTGSTDMKKMDEYIENSRKTIDSFEKKLASLDYAIKSSKTCIRVAKEEIDECVKKIKIEEQAIVSKTTEADELRRRYIIMTGKEYKNVW